MRILATLLLCAAAALAQTAHPDCGAEGDHVLIKLIEGEGFAESPVVEFGDTEAQVIGSKDDRILVRVPAGLTPGEVEITVDGAAIDSGFVALEDGAPVVLHLSNATATPGATIFLIGRRLAEGDVEFLDGDGNVVGAAPLKGGFRATSLEIPDDLEPGTYTLLVTNGDGVDSGDCSPEIEIVEAGEPTLDSVSPEDRLPGYPVMLNGTDLGPWGKVTVLWSNGDEEIETFGFSNGFDKIHSFVPWRAEPGTTYDVSVGDSNTVEYTTGAVAAPTLDALDPAEGPAGGLFRIKGEGLFGFTSMPTVQFGGEDATVLFFGLKHIVCKVPEEAALGEHDVTVTVGGETSNALTFTVVEETFEVTSMKEALGHGPFQPVVIEGSGFGFPGSGPINVTFGEREGLVLFRTSTRLLVLPPGSFFDPLPAGDYEVTVVFGDEEASAGTYTAE